MTPGAVKLWESLQQSWRIYWVLRGLGLGLASVGDSFPAGVNTPWRTPPGMAYPCHMRYLKQGDSPQDRDQRPHGPTRMATFQELNQGAMDYAPLLDRRGTKTAFGYMNYGAWPGHEVRNWLATGMLLLEEHNQA